APEPRLLVLGQEYAAHAAAAQLADDPVRSYPFRDGGGGFSIRETVGRRSEPARRLLEPAGGAVVFLDQRDDLRAQRVVAGTRAIQERRARARLQVQRLAEQCLDARP